MPSDDPSAGREIYILQNVVGSHTTETVRYTLTTDDGLYLPSGPVPLRQGFFRIDEMFEYETISFWALNASGGERQLVLSVVDVPPFVEIAANPVTCNLNLGADNVGRVILAVDFRVDL